MIGKNLGISEKSAALSTKILNKTLADESVLLQKTRKAHWHVRGPEFYALHRLWQEQYEGIAEIVDEVAERVRMLGHYPIGTLAEIARETTLQDDAAPFREASSAVEALHRDHEEVCRNLRDEIGKLTAVGSEDVATVDALTGIIAQHEKMAWMLGSFLEGASTRPANL
jgi:starvation-inducible DNA-binding protein